MPQDHDPTKRGLLRVTLQEPEIRDLMGRFPKLSRTEICDVITHKGPMRHDVETELVLVSGRKR